MRIALIALALAVPALPAAAAPSDSVAHAAITSGALERAEAKLMAELRIHPGRPELLLNLAAIHARTGRAESARAIYQQVLAGDEVLMDLADQRTAGSHALARAGMSRLNTVLSSR